MPIIAKKVMANGFKTKTGFVSIAGLNCLPIWLYCIDNQSIKFLLNDVFGTIINTAFLYFFLFGRILCFSVEVNLI